MLVCTRSSCAVLILLVLTALPAITIADIQASGSFFQSDSLTWTVSSDVIDRNLTPGETQTTTQYGETTMAQNGKISYTKVFMVDTRNPGFPGYGVDSQRSFSFQGYEGGSGPGSLQSGESVGYSTMMSPDSNSSISGFSESVGAGSYMDLVRGTASTTARVHPVQGGSNLPRQMVYQVQLQGSGPKTPAIGSAGAYMDVKQTTFDGNTTRLKSDLRYTHSSSVQGLIGRFEKSMQYASGNPGVTG